MMCNGVQVMFKKQLADLKAANDEMQQERVRVRELIQAGDWRLQSALQHLGTAHSLVCTAQDEELFDAASADLIFTVSSDIGKAASLLSPAIGIFRSARAPKRPRTGSR